MERQFDRLERDILAFGNPWTKLVVPTYSRLFSAPMTIYESETPGKYTVNVVIGESVPAENVKVTLTDRVVKIEAKYEHKAEDGQSSVSQEFMRQFTLPENVDLSQVKSFYTGDGILKIEGPVPIEENANEKLKEIPIKVGEAKAK
jgi:HSP20 family molecular chaperone IbpA